MKIRDMDKATISRARISEMQLHEKPAMYMVTIFLVLMKKVSNTCQRWMDQGRPALERTTGGVGFVRYT